MKVYYHDFNIPKLAVWVPTSHYLPRLNERVMVRSDDSDFQIPARVVQIQNARNNGYFVSFIQDGDYEYRPDRTTMVLGISHWRIIEGWLGVRRDSWNNKWSVVYENSLLPV